MDSVTNRSDETFIPVVLRPGCKVNLYLEILGRDAEGYHELDTLFYPLASPCDVLTITPGNRHGLHIECAHDSLRGKDNILHKAYNAFAERTGFAPDLTVHLEKHIPMGGGLGGGSSDAAAFLTFLNTMSGKYALTTSEMAEMGCGLGADIPFFFKNRPCRAGGRGEKLTEVEVDLGAYYPLLVCPDVQVATSWAYQAFDEHASDQRMKKKIPRILTRQTRADRYPSSRRNVILYNDFERVVFPVYPELYDIKLRMLAFGACGCVMSGSGASIFALFRREDDRESARKYLSLSAISHFI